MENANLYLSLISAAGMSLVGLAAIVLWRQKTHLPYRWFLLGGALWAIAVQIKFAVAIPANPIVYGWIRDNSPQSVFLPIAGLYGGLLSSVTEIGLIWIAVLVWRQLGRSADRAIGIGLGAGSCEALYFGAVDTVFVIAALIGYTQLDVARDKVDVRAAATPLFWLVGPVERLIVVLCHAASRALVLLGTTHQRAWMIFWGFALFTVMDGIGTAAIIHGKLDTGFIWWVELALLPLAVVSLVILRWCWIRFDRPNSAALLEPEMPLVN